MRLFEWGKGRLGGSCGSFSRLCFAGRFPSKPSHPLAVLLSETVRRYRLTTKNASRQWMELSEEWDTLTDYDTEYLEPASFYILTHCPTSSTVTETQ